MITLRIRGELAALHFFFVTAEGLEGIGFKMGIGLNEFRQEVIKESQEIIEDEHLAIAMRSSADADSGDRDSLGDRLSQTRGDCF